MRTHVRTHAYINRGHLHRNVPIIIRSFIRFQNEMIWTSLSLLLIGLSTIRTSTVVHLENCTYAVDLYREHLNLLWASDDARTVHIQAIYSLPSSNQTFLPGHITSHASPSVALIPFFVRCTSPSMFISTSYLPFGQCASTRTTILAKKNYESTRTHLNVRSILSLDDVPLLYLTESNLLLSDCSFRSGSTVYQLKTNEIFSFRIEYESALSTNCQSCNQRTATCDEQTCQCRSGAIPLKLHHNHYYCIDVTQDCSLDPQRCLHTKSLPRRRSDPFLFLVLLSILLGCLFCLLLVLLWCLVHYRKPNEKECDSNQSIYTVEKHERTPSTISTTDSLKGHGHWPCMLTNEYVSQFYEDYPRIIGEENNGEIVLILA